MKTNDFFYKLPKQLIAQTPTEPRDHSRMMVLDKKSGKICHKHFYDVIDEFMPGDCLILNDSRVMPARIYGIKRETGAKVEFLLLHQKEKDIWETLAGPGKKAKLGSVFDFSNSSLKAEVMEVTKTGNRIIKFTYKGNFYDELEKIGEMPLPHYITEILDDKERYQTIYSDESGSVAAPTAGLHFTKRVMQQLKEKGVQIGFITLHVGLGTFKPVKTENIIDHKMHSEHYELSKETADLINKTKKEGHKVFAVGTTSCRTLESVYKKEGCIKESVGFTDIFIYPGYKFNILDGLITNFHLPESTLIMLVSAFAGYDNIMNAYNVAVNEKYRFFSFGDSMLIE